MSCLVWEQAACPRTGNSFESPPPWFWLGLGRQRTVRWPFGSPEAYQLAMNSPVWKAKWIRFRQKSPLQMGQSLKSIIISYPSSCCEDQVSCSGCFVFFFDFRVFLSSELRKSLIFFSIFIPWQGGRELLLWHQISSSFSASFSSSWHRYRHPDPGR